MKRSLVVNADDLGLTVGVNKGIFDAYDRGILTSASLFANAPATVDAVRRAHVRPALGVGCHLTLVDGQPTLSPERLPTLVADDGRFRPSWKPFIVACLRGQVSLVEVEGELTAQVDRLRSDGIALTHLDAHKHVHAFPPIFAIVARIAGRFKIPVVRVPFERWTPFAGRGVALDRQAQRQALLNFGMWPWARRDYRAAAAYGLRTPNFAGRIHTGVLNAGVLKDTLHSLRTGVTELMVHPGYVDDALSQTATRLLTSRAREVELLCAQETWDLIVDERLDLIRHDPRFSTQRSLRNVS